MNPVPREIVGIVETVEIVPTEDVVVAVAEEEEAVTLTDTVPPTELIQTSKSHKGGATTRASGLKRRLVRT